LLSKFGGRSAATAAHSAACATQLSFGATNGKLEGFSFFVIGSPNREESFFLFWEFVLSL
jgi:hypothetical protein